MVIDHGQKMFLHDYKNPLLLFVRELAGFEIHPSSDNGLSKKSVADCLQTRPIDHRHRLVKIRGRLSTDNVNETKEYS